MKTDIRDVARRCPFWTRQKSLILARFCILLVLVFSHLDRPVTAQGVVARAQRDVAFLTARDLMGRGYSFDGHLRAAAYIQAQFRSLGLDSLAPGYFHPFSLEADLFLETPSLSVNGHSLRLGIDFIPFASSGSGRAQQHTAIRDLGHGLYLPDHGINDYGMELLDGQIAVFRSALPEVVAQDTTAPSQLTSPEGRVALTMGLRATAVVVLEEPLIFGRKPFNATVPVFEVRADAWPDTVHHVSYAVTSLHDQPVVTNNVIGVIPGTQQPDSTLLLVAHYDHLGALGKDFYFPGANDNASGVALLLRLARYFKANPLRYTLIFVAFSGEESGLLGSKHFAEQPVVDLEKTRFLLNFDMVASGEDGVVAVGGNEFQDEYALLDAINARQGGGTLRKRRITPNGDHYFILQQGVRGFYLYTNRGTQPYHHGEDLSASLEWDDFMHVYELARAFLERL